jgi:arginyl-tRNA synthetase
MSTPARGENEATDEHRREVLARLTQQLAQQLDEALAGVEIARAEVGEAERKGGRVIVPVAVEVAEDADAEAGEASNADSEKSWSEEDPESFEEAVEYVLEKNRELYERLS